jgi:hypothetical protein
MPTPPPQVRPIITETTEAAAVLDRLMMACVTGKNAETVLGPGGLGALTEHKLWTEAAEGVARLDAVHRDAQHIFLNTWKRVGYVLRGCVGDDDAFFAMLRKLLPAYDGPAQTLYRGQRKGEAPQPSWTRSEHIACKVALYGTANVEPVRLVARPPKGVTRFADGIVLTARVRASRIISAPCLRGEREGEFVLDVRAIKYTEELAAVVAARIRADIAAPPSRWRMS